MSNSNDSVVDVVVRIYDVTSKPDSSGKVHRLTVSLSMPWTDAQASERDSQTSLAEAFGRAQRVLKRDGVKVEIDSATWVRELYVPASRAKKTQGAA